MTKIDKNNIKRIYNYSLRSIAAFCSARKDLKRLCLKLSSEPTTFVHDCNFKTHFSQK